MNLDLLLAARLAKVVGTAAKILILAAFTLAADGEPGEPGLQALPPAAEISRHVEQVNRFGGVRNLTLGGGDTRIVLLDRAPGKPATVNTLQRYRNNDYGTGAVAARDLVIFRAGRLRGTGLLVTDYRDPDRASSYLVWLPALRKIRRFAQPDPADAWGGSNFSYGDVYLRRAQDEDHELLGIERFPGCLEIMDLREERRVDDLEWQPPRSCAPAQRETYKLRSRPRDPRAGYDYRIVWVDRTTFADYRSEFFRDGEPWKRMDKDWRSMGLEDPKAQYWVYWYARTYADGHEGMAYINPEGISWNTKTDPGLWTESFLRRINR